jgi:hypothetical protein
LTSGYKFLGPNGSAQIRGPSGALYSVKKGRAFIVVNDADKAYFDSKVRTKEYPEGYLSHQDVPDSPNKVRMDAKRKKEEAKPDPQVPVETKKEKSK